MVIRYLILGLLLVQMKHKVPEEVVEEDISTRMELQALQLLTVGFMALQTPLPCLTFSPMEQRPETLV